MKKYIAAIIATVVCFMSVSLLYHAAGQGSTPTPTPGAYRGNLVEGPQGPTNYTLNTQQPAPFWAQSILNTNLGGYAIIFKSETTGTNNLIFSPTYQSGTVPIGELIPGSSVIESSTQVEMYTSATTALIFRSGTTVVTATGANGPGTF